ncbi:MAG: PEP-CTERM sorting domain-containing protein [Nitrospinota bacterium]|nr:MAG: PEP-CTERM sorting domain-containing protein [Nitrospinota bacterium]
MVMLRWNQIIVAMLGLSFLVTQAWATSVVWEGITWTDAGFGNTLDVTASDHLLVGPGSSGTYGVAHYNTDSTFRAATTPFVEVFFIDTGGNDRVQLWMEDETLGPLGSAGAWMQFGTWYGLPATYGDENHYGIYYNDYDADLADDGTVNFSAGVFIDTGIDRTAGEHRLILGRRADGTIDWTLDNTIVLSLSPTEFSPNYFGDIYLAARYNTAEFTNYRTGLDYAPIPEPATLLLVASGVLGMAGYGRFRGRKNRKGNEES